MFKKKGKKNKTDIKLGQIANNLKNNRSLLLYSFFILSIILSLIIDGFAELKFIIIFSLVAISICSFFYKKKGLIKDFVLIIFFAISFRSLVAEPFHIPSGSMKPNLLIHDYIIVSKLTYGYSRYSLPFGLNFFSGRVFNKTPERGDVAVFKKPNKTNINYIKRIIGLPGDKIQMMGGKLFINGVKIKTEKDGYFQDTFKDGNKFNILQFRETLPNNKIVKVIDLGTFSKDNTKEYFVTDGYYFVMGDNRDNSEDSRFENSVGLIPHENLVGEAKIIFFSAKYPFLQFWKWPFNIRLDRIFKLIK